MLIRLYPIVLMCIYFEVTNLTIEKKQGSKLCLHFVDIFNENTLPEGIMKIFFLLHCKTEYTAYSLKKLFSALFLGLKCHKNQAKNDISTNPSGQTFTI